MNRQRIGRLVIVFVAVVAVFVVAYRGIARTRFAQQGRLFFGLREVGFMVTGTPVNDPITDWSFTDKIQHVKVETQTWYGVPYTVTIDMCRVGQQMYLFSCYLPPAPGEPDLRNRFPEARVWNKNVVRDPRIRVQMGDQVFGFLAHYVSESAHAEEYAAARKACIDKNPDVQRVFTRYAPEEPKLHVFRLTQRDTQSSEE